MGGDIADAFMNNLIHQKILRRITKTMEQYDDDNFGLFSEEDTTPILD